MISLFRVPAMVLMLAVFSCSKTLAWTFESGTVYEPTDGTKEQWDPNLFISTNDILHVHFIVPDQAGTYAFESELAPYSHYTSAVMRAMDTVARTFSNKPSQPVYLKILLVENEQGPPSGFSDVNRLIDPATSAILTKTTWGEGDLHPGAKNASLNLATGACVNNVEHIWKNGLPLLDSSFREHASISFTNITGFYTGTGTDNVNSPDMETITLHEMGHILGVYVNGNKNSKSAFEMLTESNPSPLPDGGLDYYFHGSATDALTNNEGVKLQPAASGSDSHVQSPKNSVMLTGADPLGIKREYTVQDLAMFQDMGWTLAVPEPSSAGLAIFAGSLLLLRRKRSTPIFSGGNNR